ncbi:MAG: methyl-accepting chemotaxis protein [Desulfobulbaceae bacterium]|nr:methyl-accepting chemotaxis protein [Desulfobulbaceae bacterium]HIJ78760.1 hypothetical protein [Deltaproteobacteria bacterium]
MSISFISKIGNKLRLYFAFISLGLFTSAIIVFALVSMNNLSANVAVVRNEVFPETKIAIKMEGIINQVVERFNAARATGSEQALEKITPLNKEVHTLLNELARLKTQVDANDTSTKDLANAYKSSHEAGVKMVKASIDMEFAEEGKWTKVFDAQNKFMLKTLEDMVAESSTAHTTSMQNIFEVSRQLFKIMTIAFVVLSAIGITTFYLVSNMSKKLESMSEESAKATNSLMVSMAYISEMSTQLSIETSSSAESLAEIANTVEEMAGQANDNVVIAREADNSTKHVLETAEESGKVIKLVVEAMVEMAEADREISSLVKVIEDIAFQTNLLALNAAVEAARAGEAGAGFAVVADEVRNLAMRATKASKQVATLIEKLDTKIKQGETVVSKLQETFPQVSTSSNIVATQTAKIIKNSSNQAQKQNLVKSSLATIDSSVQSLAAMSEEGSATVAEIQKQVENINALADSLMIFWEGHSSQRMAANNTEQLPALE